MSSKEEHMPRFTPQAKLALLVVLLVLASMVMGTEPWGPV
jgi:hypothetical protein